jgi:hypothetical protein
MKKEKKNNTKTIYKGKKNYGLQSHYRHGVKNKKEKKERMR